VARPIICEMARVTDVVFSLSRASISHQQGRMLLTLTGEPDPVRQAEAFFRNAGVAVMVTAEHMVDAADVPDVPRCEPVRPDLPTVERKLWLTISAETIDRPVLWEMSRRFDVVFDVRQSSIGRDVGIVGLLLRGPVDEVDGACDFLAELGIEIEPIEKSVIES
jgi:hypothetical protein